jgi:hypothetical protein
MSASSVLFLLSCFYITMGITYSCVYCSNPATIKYQIILPYDIRDKPPDAYRALGGFRQRAATEGHTISTLHVCKVHKNASAIIPSNFPYRMIEYKEPIRGK